MDDKAYETQLTALHLALVQWQTAAIAAGERVVIVLEGRDAAGKDGLILALTRRMSLRKTRVAALPKPTERQQGEWFFQRYVAHLPSAGEVVIFNRSWYNRGVVEPVNGFCTPEEATRFLTDAPVFEAMLTGAGIRLVKLWLDISKAKQAEELADRATNPLKALKRSSLDAVAQAKWDDYSAARDRMLLATHSAAAPWTIVRGDKKERARLETIRHLLRVLPARPPADVDPPNPELAFPFEPAALTDGRLAR